MSVASRNVDDDAPITLRSDSLAALAAFLAEREALTIAAKREADDAGATLLTSEDWELSQFWYDETTARFLAAEVSRCAAEAVAVAVGVTREGTAEVDAVTRGGNIIVAFVSSPSAYKAYRASGGIAGVRSVLLEYDSRFNVFGEDFVQFDYKAPEALRDNAPFLLGNVDVFLIDPPFLNAECLSGFAAAVSLMKRSHHAAVASASSSSSLISESLSTPSQPPPPPPPPPPPHILLASGAVMLQSARSLLGLRPTRASIKHAAGRLSNPFALYANYMRNELGGWEDEEAESVGGNTA
jgi:hypothetical protein